MKLVDANVLLHAVNDDAPDHERARTWLEGALNGQEPIGLPWIVLLTFIRIATHPRVFRHPLSVDTAIGVASGWVEQPSAVIVEPGLGHLDDVGALLRSTGTGGNLVNDAHIAAIAVRNDAEVVTFDRDFERFPGVRTIQP